MMRDRFEACAAASAAMDQGCMRSNYGVGGFSGPTMGRDHSLMAG
jgi:hypothetical protein